MSALGHIRQIDYTVIPARDLPAMLRFYREVLGFPLQRKLSERWFEFRVGSNILALTAMGGRFRDPAPPTGAAGLQLAFRVPPSMVAACAEELAAKGVSLADPLTDHAFGHRTIFFRDPDGNLIEIYAEI
jgi:lactoylglutathione lyase